MARTNVVVDEALVERVKTLYGLRTTRETIDFALRHVADVGDPYAIALELEGTGVLEDIEVIRGGEPIDGL